MSHPREQIIDDVRRQLNELRQRTAHSQMLIDAITSNLNQLTSSPAAAPQPAAQPMPQPVPQMTPAPPQPAPIVQQQPPQKPSLRQRVSASMHERPQLSTEQRIMRWAAIIGSVITFVGACLGIALAIQSGLLGPVGRAVGAALLAVILLGIGIWLDVRKGTNAGVMALYVTSFLILALDLFYVGMVQNWVLPDAVVLAFILLWTGYLALAKWRNNLRLVVAMCIILVFYSGTLITKYAFANALVLVPPVLVVLMTWWMCRQASPRMLTIVRTVAGLLLAWQTWLVMVLGDFISGPYTEAELINAAVVIPLVGVVLLVVGELFFRPYPATPRMTVAAGVVAPALVLLLSHMMLEDVARWILVAVAVAVTYLVTVVGRGRPGSQQANQAAQQPANSWLITGWFMVLPFTFLPLLLIYHDAYNFSPWTSWVPRLTLLVMASAVVFLTTRVPVRTVPVLAAWAIMVLAGVWDALFTALNPLLPLLAAPQYLAMGVALAVLLVVCIALPGLRQVLSGTARKAFAAYGLLLEMVAVVTITQSIGELISPSIYNSTTHNYEGHEGAFYVGHMIVSISWMALAAWLLVKRASNRAHNMDAKSERTAGLIIAIVATAKLVLFDMAALDGIPRVLTFIVSGLLLIAVAAKGAQRKQEPGELQPQPQLQLQPQLHQRPEEFAGK